MRKRFAAVGLLILLAFATFHVPTILTGMVLVSDAPAPAGWDDAIASARSWVARELPGFYGLRFAGLACIVVTHPGESAATVVLFDLLGPFAPARTATARSSRPFDGSDAGWTVRIPEASDRQTDASALVEPGAAPCARLRG